MVTMKSPHRQRLLLLTMYAFLAVLLICTTTIVASEPTPSQLLNTELPEPPIRHSLQQEFASSPSSPSSSSSSSSLVSVAWTPLDHSLLSLATNTHAATQTSASTSSTLSAKAAAESSLAVDESILNAAAVEDTVTQAGQLTAAERALIERMIPIPKTSVEPIIHTEYMAPPVRETLIENLSPKGYPWPEKLQNALNTVATAADTRIKDIKAQSHWSKSAEGLVQQLSLKKNKIMAHVAQLTKEIRELLGKKKQIQNKQLQDKLVSRLEITHTNLKKLRRQTHAIRKNQAEMIHHKEELSHALEGIKQSLAILKGMKRKRQFPSRGAAQKLKDELAKFDPDMSFEKEADEVRALQFPDAVLAETGNEIKEQVEESNEADAEEDTEGEAENDAETDADTDADSDESSENEAEEEGEADVDDEGDLPDEQ